MLKGLQTEDGSRNIEWELLDLSRDVDALGPADHAIIAALKFSATSRSELDPRTVSASEAEKGVRQMFLERTTDYFLPPSALIGGLMGTVRHAATFNNGHDEFIFEQRYYDQWGSAQIDSFHIPTGTLSDLKTLGWYKVKMMLTKGIMEEGLGYVYQVNRQRQLLEKSTPYKVMAQHLMIVPTGIQGRVKDEAASLGVAHGMIRMDVPRLHDDDIVEFYKVKADALAAAMEANAAPYCTVQQTWGGKKCAQSNYCPVNKECWKRAFASGETHPYLRDEPK
jgi:hypothetical protein